MSNAKRLVLWGSSGHARVVADIVRSRGDYELAGLLDDRRPELRGQSVAGMVILGGREELAGLKQRGVSHLLVAIGDCGTRHALAELALAHGFELATAIHASAVVASSASLAEGSVVAAAGVINPDASVGRNCIINTSASVDHDCVIGDAVHVGPGVHLGGGTHVGQGSWIGIGATILDHLSIGAGVMVGAGSVITRDVPDGVVIYGVPGRIIRNMAERS
jgi:UDP-N-acetylbacillosamine N-acetyltransferase